MLRLIATLPIGPRHAGHSRTIYGGDGLELWHELRVPWNPFREMEERVFIYPGELPTVPPAGCSDCAMVPPFYGEGLVPQITFDGSDALERAAESLGLEFEQ